MAVDFKVKEIMGETAPVWRSMHSRASRIAQERIATRVVDPDISVTVGKARDTRYWGWKTLREQNLRIKYADPVLLQEAYQHILVSKEVLPLVRVGVSPVLDAYGGHWTVETRADIEKKAQTLDLAGYRHFSRDTYAALLNYGSPEQFKPGSDDSYVFAAVRVAADPGRIPSMGELSDLCKAADDVRIAKLTGRNAYSVAWKQGVFASRPRPWVWAVKAWDEMDEAAVQGFVDTALTYQHTTSDVLSPELTLGVVVPVGDNVVIARYYSKDI